MKKYRIKVLSIQILLVLTVLIIWELLAKFNLINTFIFSSPSRIFNTLLSLFNEGTLFTHMFTTYSEVIYSFVLGFIIAFIVSIILYEFKLINDVLSPFLTMLNSMPKVALGPIIIIWCGANSKSIIVMALLINVIISIITIYTGFASTDPIKIKMFKSFHASKSQILFKLIIPSSMNTILSSLKINISLTFIGVIMGEFLVSKKGIGYLILYGTQVFNLNLVITGIFVLIIMSYGLYKTISYLEKKLTR